jgi:uncharacterized protein (DUF1697 family)
VTRCVALLRGVNVGGHRRVPMAQLRAVLTSAGLADVQTYLQSGNAVFASDREPVELERVVREVIRDQIGVDTTVLVRTAAELTATVDANPWPDRAASPTQLHAVFLSAEPEVVPDTSRYAPEEAVVRGRVAYLWYAHGAGRSTLQLALPGVEATARNWRTVLALAQLTGG